MILLIRRIILVLSCFFIISATLSAATFTSNIKKGPYMIYDNVPGTMRVLWQTDGDPGGTIDWGTTSSYGNSASPVSLGNDQYEYSITGLGNNQKIYYRVNVGGGSSTSHFYTAPDANAQNVTMYAVADARGDPVVQGTIMQGIVNDLNSDQANRQTCLMIAGDLVNAGGREAHWQDHWFARTETGTMTLQSMMPFMASGGNHENAEESVHFETFRKYYPYNFQDNTGTGVNGAYYITEYGPALIINVDMNLGGSSVAAYNDGGGIQLNDPQYNYILNALQNTDKVFKMAVYHEPAYSANGGHPDTESEMTQAREVLAPLFEAYDVKLVWNGHNHYYSRHLVNGVHHVTIGGLGAGLRTPGTGVGLQKTDKSHHFAKMELNVNTGVATCNAIRDNGSVIETWTVQFPGATGGGSTDTIISRESNWKYLDDGSDQGAAWRSTSYNDSSWSSGNGAFGYGDSSSQNTTVSYGSDSANKHPTTYYRKTFSVTDAAEIDSLLVGVRRDDGVVVYLNGTEVVRDNMPTGTISYTTYANGHAAGADETTYHSFGIDPALLQEGNNVIAAEVHQDDGGSSDTSFDLELSGTRPPSSDPVVSFITPGNNTTIEVGNDISVDVAVTDPDGVDRVRLYKDGVELSRSEGSAPYTWGPGQNDTELTNLQEGSFELTARATDDLGNVGEATVTINVEPPPPPEPVVTFITPSGDITVNIGDGLSLDVGAVDPDGIDRVRLYKDGVQFARSEGTAPYTWDPVQDPELANLQEGSFVLTARATDDLGLVGEASITVTVASSAPLVSYIIPPLNPQLIEGDDLSIEVGVIDPDGVDRVRLYKDGVQLARSEGSAPYTWGPAQGDTELMNLQVGTFVLMAAATDDLGNVGQTSITVTVIPADPYDQWRTGNGCFAPEDEDCNDNGIPDLLEFALGGEANYPPEVTAGGSSIDFKFQRGQSSVVYTIEKSTDLVNWSDLVTVSDTHGSVGTEATVPVSNSEMANGKLFLRLKVEN